jgi:hypothetical protein
MTDRVISGFQALGQVAAVFADNTEKRFGMK